MLKEPCIMILEDKELHVTVEDKAFCISANGNKLSMVLCNRISSEQEEADKCFYVHNSLLTLDLKELTL